MREKGHEHEEGEMGNGVSGEEQLGNLRSAVVFPRLAQVRGWSRDRPSPTGFPIILNFVFLV